jgi:hypothetical protein
MTLERPKATELASVRPAVPPFDRLRMTLERPKATELASVRPAVPPFDKLRVTLERLRVTFERLRLASVWWRVTLSLSKGVLARRATGLALPLAYQAVCLF